jgi:hypothetical protein
VPTLDTIREKLYIENEYGVSYQDPDARLADEDIQFLVNNHDIETDRHRSCINCQARQIIKYHGRRDKDDVPINEFRVPCKGIAKSLPPGSAAALRRMITEEGMDPERAKLLLMSTVDPVAWASLMFGFDDSERTWHLRSYQKEQLRCTSEKMVVREGRRSGKTFIVALKLIYLALNREVQKGRSAETGEPIVTGPEIMVVTPFQSQLLNIFDEMEKLLKRNADLMKRCTTSTGGSLYVKTPFFHMDFDNGAVINGFVSGVATKADGSGGGTMRGQNAQVVYVDEMDMIPEETLDKVVIPILLTDLLGEVTFIATSTPIGKRAKFYEWCMDDPTWKEDHLPSTVLPQWEKNKATFESEGNEESFKSEYMALFIDAAYGVFKPGYVYNCMKDYKYEDCLNPRWWRDGGGVLDRSNLVTCIGIDWNKNAGTEYVVIQYDSNSHKFVIVDVVNVGASEFSSVRWKEEVIRLNYKWKPDYIYADEGYGHTIIEDLKVMSHQVAVGPKRTRRDVETAKIKDRLVSFNFSSKVELRSPVDGTPITKSGKDFLVEFAVRVLEDGILWFPESEVQLRKELLNYVILRRSPTTNKPVYGPESSKVGDHRLDATMLALAGIQLQNGLYSAKALVSSAPRFLDKNTLEERLRRKDQDPDSPGAKVLGILRRQQTAFPGAIDILQSHRVGETPAEAMKRGGQTQRRTRVHGRARGRMQEEQQTVEQWLKGKAADYRGYADDTEHQYEESTTPSSHMVSRRRNRSRGISRRRR